MVSFENFVKLMMSRLSKLKILSNFRLPNAIPDNMTASKIDEISWHKIVLEFFKTYCVEETSLFNLL